MKILIDNGHGADTPGKRSPDGRLREYLYAREIAAALLTRLKKAGYDAELVTPETSDIPLRERVRRINAHCAHLGASNVLSVSIHNNAAGNGTAWCNASGFSVFVAPNASQRSKRLAAHFTREARALDLMGNRAVPQCGYWTQSLAMCRDTRCPAVLTENLFQDNRQDVDFLLSPAGREAIIDLHFRAISAYAGEK